MKLNSILAIQCIMMIKNKQQMETSNHNLKEIEKLMHKLVR